MNVGYEWYVTFGGTQFLGDVPQGGSSLFVGRCDANDFTTCLGECQCLGHCGVDVQCVGRRHRLDADRIIAADGDSADLDDA